MPDCNIALICEDDVVLDPDFIKQLGEIPWMDVPENWDIIKLAYHHLDGKPVMGRRQVASYGSLVQSCAVQGFQGFQGGRYVI